MAPRVKASLLALGAGGAAGALAFRKVGWKLGSMILKRKFDGDVKKVGLAWRSVRLPGGEKEFWFLERPGAEGSAETPLVVVPGLAAEAQQCAEWAVDLKVPVGRRVVILELPGQGRNYFGPESAPPNQAELAAWLEQMLSQLGLTEIDLYAFSIGAGMSAIHLAGRGDRVSTPRVRKAVLVNPYLFETRVSGPGQEALRAGFAYETVEAVRGLLQVIEVPCPPGFLLEAMVRERDGYPRGYWRRFVDGLITESLLPPQRVGEEEGEAPPQCLVVWGEMDKIALFSKREALMRVLPTTAAVHPVPEAGHVGCGVRGGATTTIFNLSAGRASAFLYGPPTSKL